MLKQYSIKLGSCILPFPFGIMNACCLLILLEKEVAPLNGPVLIGMIGSTLLNTSIFSQTFKLLQSELDAHDLIKFKQTILIGLIGLISWVIIATTSYGNHSEIFILSMIQFIELFLFWFGIQQSIK